MMIAGCVCVGGYVLVPDGHEHKRRCQIAALRHISSCQRFPVVGGVNDRQKAQSSIVKEKADRHHLRRRRAVLWHRLP